MRVKTMKMNENSGFVTILKGALNALIISLLLILLFAFVIKLTNISDSLIKPINQIIKVLSILLGCFFAFKKENGGTIGKGIIIGLLYTVLAFVLFSALNGQFEFSWTILLDALFGMVIGFLSSIISNIIQRR